MNKAREDFLLKRLMDIGWNFTLDKIRTEKCLQITSIYGAWGETYSFVFGPLFSVIPFCSAFLMFIAFKRGELFGFTQRFIVCIMQADVCFIFVSTIRDGLLAILDLNYGFVEFKVCKWIFYSLRIQTIIHGVSIWLKTLMILHQAFLVAFPFKARQMNFKHMSWGFAFLHLSMVALYEISKSDMEFKEVRLMQQFKPGYPMKTITGCEVFQPSYFRFVLPHSIWSKVFYYSMISYFHLIPFIIHIFCNIFLVFLLRQNLAKLRLLSPNAMKTSAKNIRFIILMKVNIFMGISFVFQELPIIVLLMYLPTEDIKTILEHQVFNGIYIIALSATFTFGKPVDLLIYASLSSAFRKVTRNLLSCLICKKVTSNKQNTQTFKIK